MKKEELEDIFDYIIKVLKTYREASYFPKVETTIKLVEDIKRREIRRIIKDKVYYHDRAPSYDTEIGKGIQLDV